MPGRSAFKWDPATAATTLQVEGRLSCRHGETVGHYAPGSIPGTPGPAARQMLQVHQEMYGCDCTREWWTYYLPGAAGGDDPDALEAAVPVADAPLPQWRYHHLIADADTDRTEKELERLSATGWEVVTLAIMPAPVQHESADFVYLLRPPARDDA